MELLLYDTQLKGLSTLDRRLTLQERKCLYLASKGKEIKETARILGVSQRTIKFHRANITKKLKVPNLMACFLGNFDYSKRIESLINLLPGNVFVVNNAVTFSGGISEY